ncbi:uncharacterized protein B0T23DRAFT_243199 [Neurospora hispaniola]|uniref:Uncharacterized protein n=1 Tax=Neurospora hispaniola TaxID=588809 RepID=A0AAJ0HZN2_9PEZI|nr:hypothetical protein B0T23DRAFT_243199 [Neurospora hispaniola]
MVGLSLARLPSPCFAALGQWASGIELCRPIDLFTNEGIGGCANSVLQRKPTTMFMFPSSNVLTVQRNATCRVELPVRHLPWLSLWPRSLDRKG